MATNNVYYVDMKQRFEDFRSGNFNPCTLHEMVYDPNNVGLAVRQLSKSHGRMALGQDGTNYKTLEQYSIMELSEIVKYRLVNKEMEYVRRTYIPKGKDKKRPLGICSVWDKLVEKCLQLVIEPLVETKFVDSSFGFREQVGTHNALAKVKNQCQTAPYVLAVDLKDYFGTLDPNIAYRELWHIGVKDKIILNYIFRFIKKGYFEMSCKFEDEKGVPQGSCLGPLISNIYLHRFDVWLKEQSDCWHDKTLAKFQSYTGKRYNMGKTNLKIGIHVRYADDILILCKHQNHAERFRYSVTKYLTKNMKLVINEEKTKIYDLTKERMKFLGYEFYAFRQNTKNIKKKGKLMVANILPQAKADEIVQKCQGLLDRIKSNPCYTTMSEWNIYVIGLHNYYRGMTHFNESFNQIGWRIKKRFYHTMEKKAKFTTEQSYKNGLMNGRYKTWGIKGYYCFDNCPIIDIRWTNWDSGLISANKGRVARPNPYDYGDKNHKTGVSLEDIRYLVNTSKYIKNSRLAMFRISKYSSVKGKSYLSGEYVPVSEYHLHHIVPKDKGGTHDFENLCVLSEMEHNILHSSNLQILYEIYPKCKNRISLLIGKICD